MLPYIELKLSSYSIAVTIGILMSVIVADCRKSIYKVNNRILLVIAVFCLIGMGIGSKILFFVVTLIPKLKTGVSIGEFFSQFINSGFVYYGGLYGAIIGGVVVANLLGIEKTAVLDFLAPVFCFFHVFGRIGCFLGGCCYGVPWIYGFAMTHDPDVRRFPVQLLEAVFELIIFVLLILKERKRQSNLMIFYLITYAVVRFFVEFLRGDEIRGIWFWGISTSQIIALFTVVGCVYLLLKRINRSVS